MAVTVILLLTYFIKLFALIPSSPDKGNIIPHILAIKFGALALFPSFAEYINYCSGFMTADFPWLNSLFGEKLGNSMEIIPNPYAMYFTNLSVVSTYLLAIIAILGIWITLLLLSFLAQS